MTATTRAVGGGGAMRVLTEIDGIAKSLRHQLNQFNKSGNGASSSSSSQIVGGSLTSVDETLDNLQHLLRLEIASMNKTKSSKTSYENSIKATLPRWSTLADVLIAGLTTYRETNGNSSLIGKHLQVVHSLCSLSPALTRLLVKQGIIDAVLEDLKVYNKVRSVIVESINILLSIHEVYEDCMTSASARANHPFINRKFHGVTIYRRLFDVIGSPRFATYRTSVLTPAIELLLIMLKLSCTENKIDRSTSEAPENIVQRLRFGLPTTMALAHTLVFGTATIERTGSKKIVRPRVPSTKLFRNLVLIASRLASLPPLLSTMAKLNVAEWALEVMKECHKSSASIHAMVTLCLNLAKDQDVACAALCDTLSNEMYDRLLRFVLPHMEGKLPVFRQTRDIMWYIVLFQLKQRSSDSETNITILNDRTTSVVKSPSPLPQYPQYPQLDQASFLFGSNNANSSFQLEELSGASKIHIDAIAKRLLSLKKMENIEEVSQPFEINIDHPSATDDSEEMDEEEDIDNGDSDVGDSDDEGETDHQEFGEKEKEELQMTDEAIHAETESKRALHRLGVGSLGQINVSDSEMENELGDDDENSKYPHANEVQGSGWVDVKLTEQAERTVTELKNEDIEPEEQEEQVEPSEDTYSPDKGGREVYPKLSHRSFSQRSSVFNPYTSDGTSSSWQLDDFCPELGKISSTSIEQQSQRIRASTINHIRPFVQPSPEENSLLNSTMFIEDQNTSNPAPPSRLAEPVWLASLQQALLFIQEAYHKSLPTPPIADILPSAVNNNAETIEATEDGAEMDEDGNSSDSHSTDTAASQTNAQDPLKSRFPLVVYDRNVLDTWYKLTGTFIADPLTLINLPTSGIPNASADGTVPPPLRFESRFESGNLCRAVQTGLTDYTLWLSTDVNTNSHTQWFFFRIYNAQAGVRYRFNIVNLEKKTSAFQKGMRPCVYSDVEANESGSGWHRSLYSDEIYYFPNHRIREPRTRLIEGNPLSRAHTRQHSVSASAFLNLAQNLASSSNAQIPNMHTKSSSEAKSSTLRGEAGRLVQTVLIHDETPSGASVVSESSSLTPQIPSTAARYSDEQELDQESISSSSSSTLQRSAFVPALKSQSQSDFYYTLSFRIWTPHENDTLWVAHFFPYTITYQRNFLNGLQQQCSHLIRQPLCYSTLGNLCELLTITEYDSISANGLSTSGKLTSELPFTPITERPVIMLSCRVHPGETNSSWCLHGLLEWICGNSTEATTLRRLAVLKIIPVLNPDGVIEGNYRCSLLGYDLNRTWQKSDSSSQASQSTINTARRIITGLAATNRLLMYIDWHGHSTMASSGLYGCVEEESSICPREATEEEAIREETENWMGVVPPHLKRYRAHLFPMLLFRRAPHLFDYDECTYNVSNYKAGSARAVVWAASRLPACYTFEVTFYGTNRGRLQGVHFTAARYMELGKSFGFAMLDFVNPNKTAFTAAFDSLMQKAKDSRAITSKKRAL